jgi:hypothetical protein
VNQIKTRTATIFMDADDILHIVMHRDVKMDYEDALDNYLVVKNFTGGKKILKLIDSREPWSIDRKARAFLNKKEIKEHTIARAVVHDSAFTKILSSFILSITSSPIPVKVFTNIEEARAWLLEMKKNLAGNNR